ITLINIAIICVFHTAFMYSYYALRALKIRVPKPISMFITTSQILQMVIGVTVNVYGYLSQGRGEKCDVSDENIQLSLLMYSSYFVLFVRFFYNSYIGKRNKK